jgi:hypothetical protein
LKENVPVHLQDAKLMPILRMATLDLQMRLDMPENKNDRTPNFMNSYDLLYMYLDLSKQQMLSESACQSAAVMGTLFASK